MSSAMFRSRDSLLIDNAVVFDGTRVFAPGAVLVRDGVIRAVGEAGKVRAAAGAAGGADRGRPDLRRGAASGSAGPAKRGRPVLRPDARPGTPGGPGRTTAPRRCDAGGRLVLPGLLNAHTHLYSAFAPGLVPQGPTQPFPKLLENLWWRLDAAHDEESVYYSALAGLIDNVKHGVTSVFEHHASMGYVAGSLATVAAAYAAAGVRGAVCFEMSERAGLDAVDAHLRENLDFFERHRDDPMLQGLLGLHANLTLSNETLERIARERPDELPVHIHCGEAPEDLDRCRREGYEGPVDRLHRFGLLDAATILAHCIHLSDRDYALLDEIGPMVVMNPESNANNAVGHLDPERIPDFLFGTDGMTGDPIGAARFHFLALRDGGATLAGVHRGLFENARKLLGWTFAPRGGDGAAEDGAPGDGAGAVGAVSPGGGDGAASPGELAPGAAADIAVLDYVPVAPIEAGSIVPHLIYGAGSGRAFMTICDGRVLFENGTVTFLEEEQFNRDCRRVAAALHRRFYEGRHHG